MDIKQLKTLLIDGDGVLWRSDEPITGLNTFFTVLAERGIRWALLTNNATRLPEQYVDKLREFGVESDLSQVFTSATVTASTLAEQFAPGTGVYVVGAPSLVTVINRAGLNACSGEQVPAGPVGAVVVGLDRDVNYTRLTIATRLILGGAVFIATNPDKSIPLADGLAPGAGSVVAAVQAATDIEPITIGKPQPAIYRTAIQHFEADPATTAMLGDRLETDILGAQRIGIATIGVLTGVMTRDQVSKSSYQPDYLFESIAELADALENA